MIFANFTGGVYEQVPQVTRVPGSRAP